MSSSAWQIWHKKAIYISSQWFRKLQILFWILYTSSEFCANSHCSVTDDGRKQISWLLVTEDVDCVLCANDWSKLDGINATPAVDVPCVESIENDWDISSFTLRNILTNYTKSYETNQRKEEDQYIALIADNNQKVLFNNQLEFKRYNYFSHFLLKLRLSECPNLWNIFQILGTMVNNVQSFRQQTVMSLQNVPLLSTSNIPW